MCIFCREERHRVVSSFGKPLGIVMTRTTMLVHDYYLCFGCDPIEEFFDIIADSRTDVIRELLCIIEEHDVIKCEIVIGFPFSIGGNIGRECICPFETVRHFVADPAG